MSGNAQSLAVARNQARCAPRLVFDTPVRSRPSLPTKTELGTAYHRDRQQFNMALGLITISRRTVNVKFFAAIFTRRRLCPRQAPVDAPLTPRRERISTLVLHTSNF